MLFFEGGENVASRIKGITVEIGGDTTGLQKALKGVNSSIRNTQSSLRDVNRLLKLDPKNTTLLSQKQKLLKDAIGDTKDKLETLKTAQEQAKEQLENGTLGRDKYDALQREIIETENELKRLEKEAKEAESGLVKLAEAGGKMEIAGDKIAGAGKAVMPLSAGVSALGAAAVKTTADFDASMSKVQAVSGATGKEFDALREKAREMGAKTKFSASEAADAMNYMAMAGWKTEDMLSGIEGIMNLAAASGEDLATTSDIVTDALTAFGMTAKDSGHFADILAAASSNANTNVSMMGETFKYAAPVAGALGFTAEDTAQAIGLMANAGIKSSQAGTALRSTMTKLSKDFTISGKNIGDVTIKTKNADGSMRELNDILADSREAFAGLTEAEKAQAAQSLVGKNAMSGFLALMNASPKDIEKLEGAILGCDGAAENMAEVMQDNLSGQITILKSQIQELAISFGDALMPMIRRIVSAVQRFIDMLNNMSDGTRNFILRIGMLVAATGPFLFVLGTIISKTGTAIKGFTSFAGLLGKVSTKFGGVKGVLGKVGTAIGGISAPVAIAAAAIAVLAGAIFYLWKTNKKFRQNITTIWNSIKKTIVTFVNEIKSKLGGIGTEFSMALAVIKKVWSEASKVLAPLFERGFKAVSIVLSTVLNTILGVLDVFLGIFNGNWKQAWEGIKTIFSSVWSGIKGMLSLNLGVIKSILTSVLSFISSKWRGIWSGIKAFAVGLWSSLKQSASNIWTSIKNAVLRPVTSLKSNLSSIWNGIKSTVSSVWQSIKNAMINPVNSARDKISGILRKIKGYFPLNIGKVFSNLRLPKITVNSGKAPYGIGGKGSLPKFDIKWNAEGGIFDAASIIGYGVGEKGAEAIVPLDRFWKQLDAMAKSIIDGVAALRAPGIVMENLTQTPIIDYDKMADAMAIAMSRLEVNSVLELDGRTVARSTAPFMNKEINSLNAKAGRKLGTV